VTERRKKTCEKPGSVGQTVYDYDSGKITGQKSDWIGTYQNIYPVPSGWINESCHSTWQVQVIGSKN